MLLAIMLDRISTTLGGEYGACIHEHWSMAYGSYGWSMCPSDETSRTAWRLGDGWIVLVRSPTLSVKLENITGLSNEAKQLWNSMKQRCDELGDMKRCLSECRNNLLQLLRISGNIRCTWTQDDRRHMLVDGEEAFLVSALGALGALPPKRPVFPPLRRKPDAKVQAIPRGAINRTAEASTAGEPSQNRSRTVYFDDGRSSCG